jgi:DNA-binding NarL/FixJ family response regulator/tetratricopeptide (TPR) repeat protein
MGVGKTALLRHLAETLRADSFVVTEIAANAAASKIPFGALTGFIDPDAGRAPVEQIAAGAERLGRLTETGRSVLFIDDAQHLDVASIAVIHQVVMSTDTVVMASRRDADPAPRELRDLWRHAEVDEIVLRPLDADTTQAIVAAELGSAATESDITTIVERSAGNPLFVRELVQAWRDGTPTGLTPHLVDLVDQRITDLSPDEQNQLTYIAVGQPLDLSLSIVDLDAVSRLERAGLVRTEVFATGIIARPAHPLHGEVIRTRLSPLDRRSLSQRLGAALLAQPVRRRGDALRVVTWLLEAGDRPPADLAGAAAFEACGWLDTELADRLATIAVEDDRSAANLYTLGEVRRLVGRREAAAALWEEAFQLATDDDDIRRVALSLGQLYLLFLRRRDQALDVLTRARDRIRDPAMRLGIQSDIAMAQLTGHRHDSIADIERLLDDPNCGDESAWTALSNLLWAKATSLDLEGVERHLERARDVEPRLPADRDGELDLIHALFANIDHVRQGPPAGLAAAEAFRVSADTRHIARGITTFTASQLHQIAGNIDAASSTADDAIVALDAYDMFNAGPMVRWHASIVAHHRGDDDRGTEFHDAAVARSTGDAPWQEVWLPRSQAWMMLASGDVDAAIRCACNAGKGAFEAGEIGWGVYCYHDAVIWGGADEALDALQRVRPHTTNVAVLDLLFDHAEAAATRSPGALAHVARRFEAVGARWYAAAAWANRAVCVSDEVESCCDATRAVVMSPVRGLHPAAPALALTSRQLDIACAAATGQTSRVVGEALFLSPRTVDNHLREIYRRLGVAGRSELADLIPL